MLRYNLILFIFFTLLSTSFAQGQAEIDSLVDQLNYTKRDTNKLKLLLLISNKYYNNKADYVNALPFCEQALDLANELKANPDIAKASENLATCQEYIGDYSNALKNYLNAIQFWEDKGDNLKAARLFMRIAAFHKEDYEKSILYINKALSFSEREGKNAEIAYILRSMSGAFSRWCKKALSEHDSIKATGYFTESITLFERALNLKRIEGDTNEIAQYLCSIGVTYDKYSLCDKETMPEQASIIHVDYLEKSIKSFEEAIVLYSQKNNEEGIIAVKHEIGNLFLRQGIINQKKGNRLLANKNFKKALKNYLFALSHIKAMGFEHGIANFSKATGEAYLMLGDLKSSEKFLLESERIFKKRNFRPGVLESYLLLSHLYEKKSDNKNALLYYKKFSELNDSLVNKASTDDRDLLIALHDLRTKSTENALLIKDKELSESKIQRQIFIRNTVLASAGGIILLFILGLSSVTNKRKREKSDSLREKAEFEIQLTAVQQEALNAQMSSHFIGNTMNSINSFIQKNERDKASEYLLLFHRVIRRVLENSFQKLVPLENDLEVLKGYFNLEKLRFRDEGLRLEINIDEGIDLDNTLIPPMILQTLVENSIKHGFRKTEGGVIKVSIEKFRDQIECDVEDNGIGRSASMLLNRDENGEHQSYGSALAERLVTTAGGMKRNTSYNVVDLFDEEGKPSGTRTEIKFPITTY